MAARAHMVKPEALHHRIGLQRAKMVDKPSSLSVSTRFKKGPAS